MRKPTEVVEALGAFNIRKLLSPLDLKWAREGEVIRRGRAIAVAVLWERGHPIKGMTFLRRIQTLPACGIFTISIFAASICTANIFAV